MMTMVTNFKANRNKWTTLLILGVFCSLSATMLFSTPLHAAPPIRVILETFPKGLAERALKIFARLPAEPTEQAARILNQRFTKEQFTESLRALKPMRGSTKVSKFEGLSPIWKAEAMELRDFKAELLKKAKTLRSQAGRSKQIGNSAIARSLEEQAISLERQAASMETEFARTGKNETQSLRQKVEQGLSKADQTNFQAELAQAAGNASSTSLQILEKEREIILRYAKRMKPKSSLSRLIDPSQIIGTGAGAAAVPVDAKISTESKGSKASQPKPKDREKNPSQKDASSGQ